MIRYPSSLEPNVPGVAGLTPAENYVVRTGQAIQSAAQQPVAPNVFTIYDHGAFPNAYPVRAPFGLFGGPARALAPKW